MEPHDPEAPELEDEELEGEELEDEELEDEDSADEDSADEDSDDEDSDDEDSDDEDSDDEDSDDEDSDDEDSDEDSDDEDEEELVEDLVADGEEVEAVREDEDPGDAKDASDDEEETLDMEQHLKQVVEAALFASEEPVTRRRLGYLTGIADKEAIQAALSDIQGDYQGRGIELQSVAGGWQFRTNPLYSKYVQKLVAGRPVRLTRSQTETLAIVAYRQPITRPEIDEIRGVDSGGTLRTLLDRNLIRVLGKKQEPGRPLLYGTTKDFLQFFNLEDLRDLPTLREFSELTEDSAAEVEARGHDVPDPDEIAEAVRAQEEAALAEEEEEALEESAAAANETSNEETSAAADAEGDASEAGDVAEEAAATETSDPDEDDSDEVADAADIDDAGELTEDSDEEPPLEGVA